MKKENDPHPVRISLRDWSKAKKVNRPVAEIHTNTKKKGESWNFISKDISIGFL